MAVKEHLLIPLYQQYIKDSYKGKRTKPNGERIRPQSVKNYEYNLALLVKFAQASGYILRIKEYNRLGKRERLAEVAARRTDNTAQVRLAGDELRGVVQASANLERTDRSVIFVLHP